MPEAESVVSEVRARHDPSVQFGVPAHVTLLFPPQPSAPFIALTRGIAAALPRYPPYEGRDADIVPHLAVGEGSAAAVEQARGEISAVLAKGGPIRSICRAATLQENSGGPWRVMHTYPFVRSCK